MTRRRFHARRLLAGAAALMCVVTSGCGGADPPEKPGREDRFVDIDKPRPSPSGQYVAKVEYGPDQDGVRTWIVVIEDSASSEVFRDDYAYSTRHRTGVTWLSSSDQLWILSSDVGTAHIDQGEDGTWTKTAIQPETVGDIPEEIQRYRSR